MNNNVASYSLLPSMMAWKDASPANERAADNDRISWKEPENEKSDIFLTEEYRAIRKMRNEFEDASFEELAAFKVTYNDDDYEETED